MGGAAALVALVALGCSAFDGRPTATQHAGGAESGRVVGITGAMNAVRAGVSASPPIPDLAWSAGLAAVAQSYAEHLAASGCALVHSNGSYGENLAYFGGTPGTASQTVKAWAGEVSCYTYGKLMTTDSCSSACSSSGGCGHYTQIVWRTTELVGCGVASCGGAGPREIWVCNFDPPGNYIGQAPY